MLIKTRSNFSIFLYKIAGLIYYTFDRDPPFLFSISNFINKTPGFSLVFPIFSYFGLVVFIVFLFFQFG